MKISVSLAGEQVEFLDALARELGQTRSGVLQLAVRRLRATQVGDDYEAAWSEWEGAGEGEAWTSTTADGLTP
ncbi:MAG: ribbon-helix-helix domain-containing protein [Nocardioides sp.]